MRFSGTLLLRLALAAGLIFAAALLARTTPTEAAAERFAAHDSTAYTLPPAKLAKAAALDRTRIVLTVAASAWWLLQLWLLLGTGAVARMRDFATGLSKSRWLQCYVFLGCLLLAVALLNLPLGIYGHRVALRDGVAVGGCGWRNAGLRGGPRKKPLTAVLRLPGLPAARRRPAQSATGNLGRRS